MITITDVLIAILLLCGVCAVIGNFVMIIVVGVEGVEKIDKFLNPKTIYKNHKVNKFGCTMLTLFYNMFFIVHSIWFWFYKLCTVGRSN